MDEQCSPLRNSGITLIALIITIIILLILAGVAIHFTLGENGILRNADLAGEKTNEQTATERINLKITNSQISTYAKEQRMPTLQELSDYLCEDEEIQYVSTKKRTASKEKIVVGDSSSIYTKLNEYPYEFEINSSLQLASIDGKKINSEGNIKDKWDSAEIPDFMPIVNINGNIAQIEAKIESTNEIKGYVYLVNDKVELVSSNFKEEINLKFNQSYKISVVAIDTNGNLKKSADVTKTTEDKLYILNETAEDNPIMGGINVGFTKPNSYDRFSGPNGCIYLLAANSGNKGIAVTNNKIDLTNINTLEFDIEGKANHASLINTLYVGISKDNEINDEMIEQKEVSGVTPIERQTLTVDVSNIKGEYYIKVIAYHGTNVANYGTQLFVYNIIAK